MLEPGFLVGGKYKILDVIGRGGMSVVYLAINEKANRPWAVKELTGDRKRRFCADEKEIELMKKLRHPNLPGIADVIEYGEALLIVMDYIEGRSLDKVLRDTGPRGEKEVLDWAGQLCGVLDYLHSRNPPVIYRDLKPSNVMLRPDGKVVLIDFGAAREYARETEGDTVLLGTKGYAAPEQYGRRGQSDGRTDIYSLGVLMFELLTGEGPHSLQPVRALRPDVSAGLQEIVRVCTRPRMEDRYQSCRELQYALSHHWELDARYREAQGRKLRWFLASTTATLLMGAGAALFSGLEARAREHTYEAYLMAAGNSVTKGEEMENYRSAIRLAPERKEGYLRLLEEGLLDDQLLTSEESAFLRAVLTEPGDSGRTNEEMFAGNEEGYAEFAYEAGVAYFYKFEETGNKKNAGNYLRAAALSGCLEGNREERAKRLGLIADYYARIGLVDAAGDDFVSFRDYWDDLTFLASGDLTETDNERTALVVYEELLEQILFCGEQFREAGVTREETEAQVENIRTRLRSDFTGRELGGEEALREERAEMERLLRSADVRIRSVYEGE